MSRPQTRALGRHWLLKRLPPNLITCCPTGNSLEFQGHANSSIPEAFYKKKNKQKTKHPSRETDSVSGKNQPLSISCPIKTHPADSSNHAHSVPFKPRKPLQSLSAKGLVMKTLARCSQRWVGEAHARPHPRVLQAWLPTPPRRLRKISEHIQTRAWPGPGREKMREGKCKTEGPQAEEALLWRGARKRVSKRPVGSLFPSIPAPWHIQV